MKKIFCDTNYINIIFSCLLSLFSIIYPYYYKYYYFKFNFYQIPLFLLFSILFLLIGILLRKIIIKLKETKFTFFYKDNNKKNIILFFIIILISWMPILISLYPGSFSNDTWGQLNQYHFFKMGEQLYDHHPVFDTLVFGTIIESLANITGNWHISMFIYVILQAILTSFVFSYSLVYAKEKLKLNDKFIIIFLILYCIIPLFPLIIHTINKDSLFSWIYILFYINYIEIIRTNGKSLNKKNLLFLIITAIFSILTKKVGIYVILISLIILLIPKINNKKKILLSILIISIIMFIFKPILFNIYSIRPGGKQEKYSLMFQQTANYLIHHSNDVTKEEEEVLQIVLGNLYYVKKVYNPIYADPVKGFHQKAPNNMYQKYLLVWLKQGFRHPDSYINAYNCMASGWFSFEKINIILNMNHHTQLNPKIIDESVAKRDWSYSLSEVVKIYYNKLSEIPIISILVSPILYILYIPIFTLSINIKYNWKEKYFLALIPVCLSIILGCLLSPTIALSKEGSRYLYPIIYSSIILLMWGAYSINNKKGGIENDN